MALARAWLPRRFERTASMRCGFTPEKLARLCVKLKASRDGRVADYAREFGLTLSEALQQPGASRDIAPLATQNELRTLTPRAYLRLPRRAV